MSARWQLSAVTLCLLLAAPPTLHAQVYRWDNGQVIPGTEGITPGRQLDDMETGAITTNSVLVNVGFTRGQSYLDSQLQSGERTDVFFAVTDSIGPERGGLHDLTM
jgi:hypothetical protein